MPAAASDIAWLAKVTAETRSPHRGLFTYVSHARRETGKLMHSHSVDGLSTQAQKSATLLVLLLLGVGALFFLLQFISFSSSTGILVLEIVSVFLGALVSGLAGFAFSAVSGAILLHWLPAVTVVPLLLACSIATQLLSITKLWRTMKWRQSVPFLIGGTVGIPVGAKLLETLDVHAFALAAGVFLICYGAYMLLSPRIAVTRDNRLIDVAAGFLGGITGGVIAFPGAIPTILCDTRGLVRHEQRGIVQPFILYMQIATLLYFFKFGMMVSDLAVTFLWCAPAALGGAWIGLHFFNRIDDATFRRAVLFFLIISGVTLII